MKHLTRYLMMTVALISLAACSEPAEEARPGGEGFLNNDDNNGFLNNDPGPETPEPEPNPEGTPEAQPTPEPEPALLGTRFEAEHETWPLPTPEGLSNSLGFAFTGQQSGHDVWSLLDINNDGLPDIVWTANPTANQFQVFGGVRDPHWRIFLNNGAGFDTSFVQWSLPAPEGLANSLGFAFTGQQSGHDVWSLLDIDNDGLSDIVWTANPTADQFQVFGGVRDPHWRVFKGAP